MNRWEAWTVHISTLLVAGTGLVYGWMRYLAEPADPFSVVGHPWQPTVQHLHVLVAPLLVFAAGLIWREHVWKHWQRGVRRRRSSGIALVLTLLPMVVSGYLIQTTISEGWRTTWVVVHCVTSGLWVLSYGGHWVAGLIQRRRAGRRPVEGQGAAPRTAPLAVPGASEAPRVAARQSS